MSDFFSFRLLDDFVAKYKDIEPPFGFVDAGGNSLGEVTFIRTYSRVKEDGTNPGAEFSRRVSSEVLNSVVVSLPPNMDITDYYLANGYDATRHLLGVEVIESELIGA